MRFVKFVKIKDVSRIVNFRRVLIKAIILLTSAVEGILIDWKPRIILMRDRSTRLEEDHDVQFPGQLFNFVFFTNSSPTISEHKSEAVRGVMLKR